MFFSMGKQIDDKGKRKTDTDRLWAKTDDRDEIFIIRYFDIDPIAEKEIIFLSGIIFV